MNLIDSSDYIRTASTTHLHLESTAIDASNNWSPELDYQELDTVKYPIPLQRDFHVYRNDTHLSTDGLDASNIFVEKGVDYFEDINNDMLDRLDHDDPYYKEHEILAKLSKLD